MSDFCRPCSVWSSNSCKWWMVNLRGEDNASDEEELALARWRRWQQCLVLFSNWRDGIACPDGIELLVLTGWNGLSERDGMACRNGMELLVGNRTSSIVTHSIAWLLQKYFFNSACKNRILVTSSKNSRGRTMIQFFFRSCRVIEKPCYSVERISTLTFLFPYCSNYLVLYKINIIFILPRTAGNLPVVWVRLAACTKLRHPQKGTRQVN